MKLKEFKGFTILEVLVAGSIMLLISYIVLKISIGILNTCERTGKNFKNNNNLKLALDIVEKDLQTSLPYYWSLGSVFSFYSFGKEESPNAIVYAVNADGFFRYVKTSGKKYDPRETLEKIPIVLREIQKASNFITKDIKKLSVKFLHKNIYGNMEWAAVLPQNASALGAEIIVTDGNKEQLTRRMTLIGVSQL